MKYLHVFFIFNALAPVSFAAQEAAPAKIMTARAVVQSDKCGVLLGLSNGVWGLPGGAIEGDESSKLAALREVREETGLKDEEIVEVSHLGVNESLGSDIFLVQVTEFACEGVFYFDDPDKEFSQLRWFSTSSLPQNIYPDVVLHIDWFLKRSS